MQLSITLASILFRRLSDLVTSLKKVKSNTTVPYIELLNCVPAKPTLDVGTSCLLDLVWCAPATATSLLPCWQTRFMHPCQTVLKQWSMWWSCAWRLGIGDRYCWYQYHRSCRSSGWWYWWDKMYLCPCPNGHVHSFGPRGPHDLLYRYHCHDGLDHVVVLDLPRLHWYYEAVSVDRVLLQVPSIGVSHQFYSSK